MRERECEDEDGEREIEAEREGDDDTQQQVPSSCSIFSLSLDRESARDVQRAQDFQHFASLSYLLDFWIEGLRLTDFGRTDITGGGTSSLLSNKRVFVPWTSLRWETVQAIVDVVCACVRESHHHAVVAAMEREKKREKKKNQSLSHSLSSSSFSLSLSETAWQQVISLVHLCIGPLVFASQSYAQDVCAKYRGT